jgi:hypothetical protein
MRPLTKVLLAFVLLSPLGATRAFADNFVVNELGNTVSINQTGGGDLIGCLTSGEVLNCGVRNSNFPFATPSTDPNPLAGTRFSVFNMFEPDGLTFSDSLTVGGGLTGISDEYLIFFNVCANGDINLPCGGATGPNIIENGQVQDIATVFWSAAGVVLSTDTIQFRSEVPEPSSLLLLLTGFAGLSVTKLRGMGAARRKVARSNSVAGHPLGEVACFQGVELGRRIADTL